MADGFHDDEASDAAPLISVVIPVRNSPEELRCCLASLAKSTYRQFEIIVVDDASTDDTASTACDTGCRLVRLPRQSGPAAARNSGAALARGRFLLFVDADVCVHPETLAQLAEILTTPTAPDAVFGSYDSHPAAKNFLSQYRNLLHHFFHQQAREEATTFWSGCGAIRRELFLKLGGFATSYDRPSIEDIELGARIHQAGGRIRLDRHLQVTHLKRWTLGSIIRTDVWQRAVPWTRLILRNRSMPNDLNLSFSQRLAAMLANGILVVLILAAIQTPTLIVLMVGSLLGTYTTDVLSRAARLPLATVPLFGMMAAVGVGLCRYHPMLAAIALVLCLGVVLLNRRCYSFFLKERGAVFAAAVLPMQLLYYWYSSFAFAVGMAWR